MTKKKTHSEFLNEINNKFPNKYEILSMYNGNKKEILVKCLVCGDVYTTRPTNILRGDQCANCKGNKKLTPDEFKSRFESIHGKNEYLILSDYESLSKPIKIKHCKCGSIYMASPKNLLKGCRCFKCYGSEKLTKLTLQNKLDIKFPNKFKVIDDVIDYDTKINIECRLCGNIISVSPHTILQGKKKCKCEHITSKGERIIENYLIDSNIEYCKFKEFDGMKNIKNLNYDFYIDSLNLAIEFDGEQHFKPSFGVNELEKNKIRDKIKNDYAFKNNIRLIRISFTEMNNIEKILNKYISSTTIETIILVGVEYSSSELEMGSTLLVEGKDIV